MQSEGPNNQSGGDNPTTPDQAVPDASGDQDVLDAPKKSAKNSTLRDIFNKGAKRTGRDYAFSKGKDYLKNTDVGKKISQKGEDLFKKLDQKTGGLAGKMRNAGITPGADKEQLKRQARDYMKNEGKQELKKVIGNRLGGGVKKGVKEGVGDLAEKGVETAGKTGAKAVVRGGAKLGTEAVVEGGIEAGAETLGAAGIAGGPLVILTEILAQLVVIAISLGISDAIDGAAALATGHPQKAMHLFIRAATKIAVFVLFVVLFIICFALLPIIGALIPLVLIHIYWGLGAVPFLKEMAIMQGLVWWEKILIITLDVAVLFAAGITIVVGLYIWCNFGAITGGGLAGSVGSTIGGALDKATTSEGSYCSAFKGGSGRFGGGGDFGGAGAGGSWGSELGDETVGTFTPPGGSCKFSGVNLCKGVVGGNCSNASVVARVQDQWGPKIREQLQQHGNIPGVANSEAFIKAIMTQESGGDPNAESPTGPSGLMQFTTASANTFGPQCSASYNSSKQWRKDHPVEQICMSIKYFQSIAGGQCGKPRVEVRNLAAGYNRGPGYCQVANGKYTSCSGETGCDGTPVKSWECLWTDAAHTSCNKYVEEGQKYAQYVFGCYTKFNQGN